MTTEPGGAQAREGDGARGGTPADPISQAEAEARARALLEATHQFPCEYVLTVIALNGESITERLAAAVGHVTGESADVMTSNLRLRPSAGGKYLSHRFSLRVGEAADVLRLYAHVKAVEGVVTVM